MKLLIFKWLFALCCGEIDEMDTFCGVGRSPYPPPAIYAAKPGGRPGGGSVAIYINRENSVTSGYALTLH